MNYIKLYILLMINCCFALYLSLTFHKQLITGYLTERGKLTFAELFSYCHKSVNNKEIVKFVLDLLVQNGTVVLVHEYVVDV